MGLGFAEKFVTTQRGVDARTCAVSVARVPSGVGFPLFCRKNFIPFTTHGPVGAMMAFSPEVNRVPLGLFTRMSNLQAANAVMVVTPTSVGEMMGFGVAEKL